MAFIGRFHPLLVHFPIALVLAAAGAAGAIAAALLSSRLFGSSRRSVVEYRFALFATALLVAITGHLGGSLVRGARFFRP
jgi:uncharacterized membrane protein